MTWRIQDAVRRPSRSMFPLYNEEVHVLASTDIATLEDLAGRKVAVGVRDSGTFLTASLILDILQVEAEERVIDSTRTRRCRSLRRARSTRSSMSPVRLRRCLPMPTSIRPGSICCRSPKRRCWRPIPRPACRRAPMPSRASRSIWSRSKRVLMTYDYDPARNAYHRESCTTVSDFFRAWCSTAWMSCAKAATRNGRRWI